VAGLVIDAGRVLLVLRRDPPHANRWSVPGGKQELGERITSALRREIQEETGLTVAEPHLLTLGDLLTRDAEGKIKYHYLISYFLVKRVRGTLRPADDALDARWYTPGEDLSPPLTPELEHLIDCALRVARTRQRPPCALIGQEAGDVPQVSVSAHSETKSNASTSTSP
jgi:ADP-ribose pyrophosphatase